MIPKKLSISCALAHVLISPCVNPKRLPDGQFLLEKLLASLLRPKVELEALDKTSITQVVLVLRMILYMAIKNPQSKLGPPAMLKAASNLESAEAKVLVDMVTKDAGPFFEQLDALFDGPGLVCGSKLHNMLIETHSAQQGNPLYDKCVEFCNLAGDTDTLVSPSVVALFRKKVRFALEAINLKRPRPTDSLVAQLQACLTTNTKTELSNTSTLPKHALCKTKDRNTATKSAQTLETKKPRKPDATNSAQTETKKHKTFDATNSAQTETKKHKTFDATNSAQTETKKHKTFDATNSAQTGTKKHKTLDATNLAQKSETKKLNQLETLEAKKHKTLEATESIQNSEPKKRKTLGGSKSKHKPENKKHVLFNTKSEPQNPQTLDTTDATKTPTKKKRKLTDSNDRARKQNVKRTKTEEGSTPSTSKTATSKPGTVKDKAIKAKRKAESTRQKFYKDSSTKQASKLGKTKRDYLDHKKSRNKASKKLQPCKKLKKLLDNEPLSSTSDQLVNKVGCYYPDPPTGGWYGVVSNAAVIFTFTHLPLLAERSNKRENKRKKGDKPVQVVLRVVQHKDSMSLVLVQNLGDCLAHVDLGMADFAGLLGVPLAVDRQALRNIPILTCAEGLCMSFDPATMLLTCSVNSAGRATLFETKVDYLKFQVPTYPPASVVCCFQVPSKSLAMLFGKSARHASTTFRLIVTRDIKRKRLFVELCMTRKTNESAKILLGADQEEDQVDQEGQSVQQLSGQHSEQVNLVTNHLKMPYARDVSRVLPTRTSTGVSLARKYSESAPDLVVLFDGVFTTAIANILVNSRAYTSVIFEPYTEQRLSIIIASNDTMLCVVHRTDLPSSSSSSSNSAPSNASSGTLPTCSSSSAPNSLTLDGNTL